MQKKHIDDFTIVANERHTREFVILTLKHPGKMPEMFPGQFVEARVDGSNATYLRRPLSIHDVNYASNTLKLLIQEVGPGTRTLSALQEGDQLNLVYPLGNHYTLPESDKVLLIGGGCGVAPLLFLGRYLKEHGITPRFLIGGRTAADLVELNSYETIGEVLVTTEDGTRGTKGYVIHHPVMKTFEPDFEYIYTCGPEPMMKVLAKYAAERDIKCQVSMENTMACGIGACLCCVTPTQDGHKCVCTDGPVFDSKYLKW
ncbi:dihydroorotate dehydrogenase electron transfer subunit [Marinilabilia salmonicolor]|uniref:dihydroorotate dehydrogenase electron transfer subunit n=1 Tax=Marinilabilia salmonicolor TaxID=989 RepID=UPI00029AD775|nr:dihydroorotate dehydrogenase electron transfer subunit [Marinilabilia salmonicolor]